MQHLRDRFPGKEERIRISLDALLFFCAASCEWEDWRHFAQVHGESLMADLGIELAQTPEEIFRETTPLDRAGKPRIVKVAR